MSDFHNLIKREIPRLRRYARALTRNGDRADDLVQETLLRAIAKSHLWQTGTDIRAWLFTIMHNQHVNHVRSSIREGVTVDLEDAPAMTAEPVATTRLELRDLERALAKLPTEQREVILLVGLEGMAYEEVAEVLGVPVGTVRSHLSRGRDALRQLMGMPEKSHGSGVLHAA
jgi:RNA polymerase sigma-70 factor, ECF subfamily